MPFKINRGDFWCVCVFIVLLPCHTAMADDSPIIKAEREIRNAGTYFWLGVAEQGDMGAFYKGLAHLRSAEDLLKKADAEGDIQGLRQEIISLRESFFSQMEVHEDTLHGVFPMIRLLGTSIFSDALALGTFEVVDDPVVMAATSAGQSLASDVIATWSSRPQLNVIVNSDTAEGVQNKIPNTLLEHEILYIFSSLPKFFPHNSQDIQTVLTRQEYDTFRYNTGLLPHGIVKKLCRHFNSEELLVVSVNEQDVVDDTCYYKVEGQVYNIHQPAPTHTFSHQGFSRDRNHYFWPGIASFFAGMIIAVMVFRWVVCKGNFRQIFRVSGRDAVVPVTAFLIGRISPWVMMPIFSKLKPPPDTLYFLSFWWPCAVGMALFFIPVLVYLRLNKYLCHMDENFEITGNGAAILLSITIGVGFYLLIPFMLYWDSIYGALRMAGIFLISGYLMYCFGSVIDQADHKVSSKTVVSGLYLFLILFVLSGAMFFGETVPFGDLWQSSSRTAGFGLLLIPAAFSLGFGKKIHTDQTKATQTPDDIKQGSSFEKPDFLQTPTPIHDMQLSRFGCWESEAFRSQIRPRIKGVLENRADRFPCTWLQLTGPAGCGKTAAAMAVIQLIEKTYGIDNMSVFTGTCRITSENEQGNIPYEPFMKAFPRHIISPLFAPRDSFYKLSDAINPGNLVPSFLGLDSLLSDFDQESERKMGVQRQKRLFTMVADYIRERAATKKPVIIFFDNIQAMDTASKELLLFLSENLNHGQNLPILFLLAFKDGQEPLPIDVPTVALQYPEPDEIRELLTKSMGLDPHAAKQIVARFNIDMDDKLPAVFHYVSMLYDHDILVDMADHRLQLAEKYRDIRTPLPDPENFGTIIRHKLEQLTKRQLRVLSFAACTGVSISVDVLENCLPNLDVLEVLEAIETKTGLVFDDPDKDGCYAFTDSATLVTVRKILHITFGGPPWPKVGEKIKKIHEQIAICFDRMAETQIDHIFDACMHYYASGGRNAETTIQKCFAAAELAKKQYNFSMAEKYIKMAVECARFLGQPLNLEEEMLLIECEKAHVQNANNCEIADNCIAYYESNAHAVSDKLLKVVARICYEADRDKMSLVCEIQNPDKYRTTGQKAAKQLLAQAGDDVTRAEASFFIAINEKENDAAIGYLEDCLTYLDSADMPDPAQKDRLASWVEDVLARKLLNKNAQNHPKAAELFQKSIDRKKRLDDRPGLSRSYGGLGSCLIKTKQYGDARDCYEKSLKYALELSDIFGTYLRYYDLGESYLVEAQEDACTDMDGCYRQAMGHFEKGCDIAMTFDDSKKDGSLFHLYAGLLLCSSMCNKWDRYNEYGAELQALARKGIWFPWLTRRIEVAVNAGKHQAGDWAGELEKKGAEHEV